VALVALLPSPRPVVVSAARLPVLMALLPSSSAVVRAAGLLAPPPLASSSPPSLLLAVGAALTALGLVLLTAQSPLLLLWGVRMTEQAVEVMALQRSVRGR
jgi:hypothetical protein